MLRQDKYILDILHRVSMSSCKPVDTFFLLSRLLWCLIACFPNLLNFIKLLVLFNISILRDQIFVLLLIRFVSLYMLLLMHIGLSLNAFYIILRVWFFDFTDILAVAPPLLDMVLQILIGLVVLMIVSLWVVILFSFVIPWFLGNQANNV